MQAAYTTTQNISAMWDTTAIARRDGHAVRTVLVDPRRPAVARAPLRCASPASAVGPGSNVVDAMLAVFVLATFTFAEHACTGRWILLGTITDLVHLGSASVWLGGVAVLATLLVAPGGPPRRARHHRTLLAASPRPRS